MHCLCHHAYKLTLAAAAIDGLCMPANAALQVGRDLDNILDGTLAS